VGVAYTDKDHDTESYVTAAGKQDATITETVKIPGELTLYYRNVDSPMLVWGLGGGWIFYERNLESNVDLQPSASAAEKFRFNVSLETREDDGGKLDWILAYDGGKTLGLSTLPQAANEVSLTAGYETTAFDALLVGWNAKVGGGTLARGSSRVIGYQASVLGFARYEFDLVPHKVRR
jgi:hypothetical protein